MSNYFADVRVFVGDQNSGQLLSTTTPASHNPITTYNGNIAKAIIHGGSIIGNGAVDIEGKEAHQLKFLLNFYTSP